MGVTNRRPSSDSELISPMEMRLPACVTKGPSREPYQIANRKHGLFHIRYFENGPLEPGYTFNVSLPMITSRYALK